MAEYTDVTVEEIAEIDSMLNSESPTTNYGTLTPIKTGTRNIGSGLITRRGIWKWDETNLTVPSNVDEIVSAVLKLYNAGLSSIDDRWIDLHLVSDGKDWVESEVTWDRRFIDFGPLDVDWSTAGGDFESDPVTSAYVIIGTTGFVLFDILAYFNQVTNNLQNNPAPWTFNFISKFREEILPDTGDEFNFNAVSSEGAAAQQPRILLTFRDWAPARVTSCTLASDKATNSVFLDWSSYNEPSDIASYSIYRETNPIAELTALTPIATGVTNRYYSDTTPSNNQKYYYVVVAIDGRGNSYTTNLTDFTITTDFNPSASSVDVEAIDSRKLLVSWTENTDGDFQKYEIYRDIGAGWVLVQTETTQTTISYTDTVVSQSDLHDYDPTQDTYPDGRTVKYKVRTYDTNNNWVESEEETGTTKKPIQPLSFSVAKQFDEDNGIGFVISIDWAAQSTPDEDYDKAEMRYTKESVSNPDEASTLGGTSAKPPETEVQMFGLDEYSLYKMIVVAYDKGGLFRISSNESYDKLQIDEHSFAKPSAAIITPAATTINSGDTVTWDARRTTDPSSETESFEDDYDSTASLDNYNTSGSPTVSGGKVSLDSATADKIKLKAQTYFGLESRNYTYDFEYGNLTGSKQVRTRFRCQTYTDTAFPNCYSLNIVNGTDTVALYRVIAGSSVLIGSAVLGAGALTGSHKITVKAIGTRLRVYLDDGDAPIIDVTDSQWAAGTIGFASAAGSIDINYVKIFGRVLDFQTAENEGYYHTFGDGNEITWSDIPNVQHTYYILATETSRLYHYSLLVTNKWGAPSDNVPQVTITVNNANPVAFISGQNIGFVNVDVFFDGSLSTDPEGGGLDYFWDWDDGSSIEQTSSPFVSHQFTVPKNPGESPPNDEGYKVKLRVRDAVNNYSSWVELTVYIYATGAFGYDLQLMSPLEHVSETQPDGIGQSDSPNLDFTIIHQLRGGSPVYNIRGIHHDIDCSHDEATRIANMKTEANLVKYLARNSVYVKLTVPPQVSEEVNGVIYGFIFGYRNDLDENDNLALPFSFNFVVIATDQITEM
jgi:hypothetical protein